MEYLKNAIFGLIVLVIIYGAICLTLGHTVPENIASLAKFKAGDCIGFGQAESWENNNAVYKILIVGKKHYHFAYIHYGPDHAPAEITDIIRDDTIDYMDGQFKKVACP